MIPRAELVVGDARDGVGEIPIHLARLDAEDIPGVGVVASEAILAAGVIPGLRARARAGRDDDVFQQTVREQVGVRIVRAPFVSDAVGGTVGVGDEEARFQSLYEGGVRLVGGQLEMFHEHRAGGERPLTIRCERDLFIRAVRRAVVRQGDPTLFRRAVRPERRVDAVRNEAVGGRQRGQVGEREGLREQRGRRLRGGILWRQFPDVTVGPNLAHVDFVVLIESERAESGVIETGRHVGDLDDGRRVRAVVSQRPDAARAVVAEDVFATEFRGKLRSTIDVAADDAVVAVGMDIVIHRGLVRPDERRGLRFGADKVAFLVGPLVIAATLDEIHFLDGVLADVAKPGLVAGGVMGHAMRTAQTDGPKFLQDAAPGVEPGIVIRDEIIAAVTGRRAETTGLGLAADGMAPGRVLIDIQAQHAGEQSTIELLSCVVIVVRVAFIAIAQIEKAVRAKEHAAAVVIEVMVELIDQHQFGIRIGDQRPVGHGEAREPVEGRRGGWQSPDNRGHGIRGVVVIDVNVAAVRGSGVAELRVEYHSEQSAIIPALRLGGQVKEQRTIGRGGVVREKIDRPLPAADVEAVRSRLGNEESRVEEDQVREGFDGSKSTRCRLARWQCVVQEASNWGTSVQSVRSARYYRRKGQDETRHEEIKNRRNSMHSESHQQSPFRTYKLSALTGMAIQQVVSLILPFAYVRRVAGGQNDLCAVGIDALPKSRQSCASTTITFTPQFRFSYHENPPKTDVQWPSGVAAFYFHG